MQEAGIESYKAVVGILKTDREQLTVDPQLVASMLQSVMVGVSRRLLESTSPEKQFDTLRQEMIALACAYLEARCASAGFRCFELRYGYGLSFHQERLQISVP